MAQWVRLPKHAPHTVAASPGSILLETSRFDLANQHSYLFFNPVRIIVANELDEIPEVFSRVEAALGKGFHAAGFFSYECGYHFEPHAGAGSSAQGLPLAWFGIYEKPLIFDHALGRFEDPLEDRASERFQGADVLLPKDEPVDRVTGPLALGMTQDDYCAAIVKIKEYIAAGETYQVNFTDGVSFPTPASAAETFQALSRQQPVAYSAFMNVAGHHILSFSPELFFRVDEGKIVTRPMKGTMPRGLDAAEDALSALRLKNDAKNRSEHVMIVDLLRNDLGRICTMGSVRVDNLFSVERYETLLQMTSTISGVLRPGVKYYDIFRSMFPSGSVTGAPKIRTMQIVRALERRPRGIYTGAIGFLSPQGSSIFNVAIRTLVMKNGSAYMGVGGGIVADSDPNDEHRECLLKASFLTRSRPDFQLIETILWEREFSFLSLHLDRLQSSAFYFNFVFDREAVLARLSVLPDSFRDGEQYRIRLLLHANGELTVRSFKLQAERSTGHVKVSPQCTSPADLFLRHKTTRREFYDRQYAEARAAGFDEVLFTNEKGEITEGAISNLFIERSGKMLTPPLACGVLPGIFRQHLLKTCAAAEERILTISDLEDADAVFLCNSVRGLREVKTLCFDASPDPGAKAAARVVEIGRPVRSLADEDVLEA
jgi:para-aminobenzoate synthetase / 4-amino-4-deoxychorismate lyase